jgi:hypothetical protein
LTRVSGITPCSKRGRVQEGLEAAARLARRAGDVVELLAVEVKAAHQRAHAAGGRVQRHEGAVGLRPLHDLPFAGLATRRVGELHPQHRAAPHGQRRFGLGSCRAGCSRRRPRPDRTFSPLASLAVTSPWGWRQHDGHAQVVVVALVLQRQCGGAFGRFGVVGQLLLVFGAAPGLLAFMRHHGAAQRGVRRALVIGTHAGGDAHAFGVGLFAQPFHHRAARHFGHVLGRHVHEAGLAAAPASGHGLVVRSAWLMAPVT